MPKYRVRYTKASRTLADVYMTVEADSPEAAFERVEAIQNDTAEPTAEEEESEEWGKEYGDGSEFVCMDNPTEWGVISEVEEDERGFEVLTSLHDHFRAKLAELQS
jgi:hypothetical protein